MKLALALTTGAAGSMVTGGVAAFPVVEVAELVGGGRGDISPTKHAGQKYLV